MDTSTWSCGTTGSTPSSYCSTCVTYMRILSVTRLAERGFNIQLNKEPTMAHRHGFDAQLTQKDGLLLHASRNDTSPSKLHPGKKTGEGQLGILAPLAMTDSGMLAQMTLTPTGVARQRRRKRSAVCTQGQLPGQARRAWEQQKDNREVRRQAEGGTHRRSAEKPQPQATQATASRQHPER